MSDKNNTKEEKKDTKNQYTKELSDVWYALGHIQVDVNDIRNKSMSREVKNRCLEIETTIKTLARVYGYKLEGSVTTVEAGN